MKKNDIVNLNIEGMTNLGFGVARVGGLVVFISGAVTGETVKAKIIKITPTYAVAKVEMVLKESPLRVFDRCQYDKCHSCAYKCISYDEEIKIKERDVAEAFKKAGLSEIKVAPLVPSPITKEYRNKAQYPVCKNEKGEYLIGYYAPKSHRVCEARHCPLTPKVFGEICEALSEYFTENDVSCYDEENGKGLLRHVYLRRGEVSCEILLTLVINGKKLPNEDALVRKITEKFDNVVGILLNYNQKETNVILGEEYRTIYGRDYIYDTLSGVRLAIKPSAFYQVNHASAELLYSHARKLAELKGDDVLLDLYCGTGSIGLSMANDVGELYGVDIVPEAIDCAKENAEAMGLKNAFFFASNADEIERILDGAAAELGKAINPDVIILDPPRGGCGERAVKFVAFLTPRRIVYISCNPSTLARDVALFKELGYETNEVTPFDLFPGTGHVESVVCLTRE